MALHTLYRRWSNATASAVQACEPRVAPRKRHTDCTRFMQSVCRFGWTPPETAGVVSAPSQCNRRQGLPGQLEDLLQLDGVTDGVVIAASLDVAYRRQE